MNIYTVLTVGIGGFLGTISRYVTVQLVDKRFNSVFPYGTLTVNLAGSFVLGLVIGLTFKQDQGTDNWRLFLTTGFCGGFTTFSAFAFENISLFQQKLVVTSLTYTLISLIAGFAAVLGGLVIGKFIAA